MMVNAQSCELVLSRTGSCTNDACDRDCKFRFGSEATGECTILSLYCVCKYPC